MYYVYCLRSSIDNSIFYIGMGQGNRMYKHEQLARRHKISNNNYRLYDKLRILIELDAPIIYELVNDNLNFQDALKLEAQKIQEVGIENLCNLNAGGTGRLPGYKHSIETRQKIAKSNTGKIKSDHTKRLIGLSKIGNKNMSGKTHSIESKKKMSDSWKTRNMTAYKTSHIHLRKKVIQSDIHGNIIKIWDSVREAVDTVGASVSDALYNRQKTAHGYIWKFYTIE